jgi:arylsulfatase A-like enzyme
MKKVPNILLILTDQFRADCLGVMGNPHIYTPYLDEFALDSAVFQRAYSPSPTCVPARACLVTGNYPEHTGFFCNNFEVEWNYSQTLMDHLRDGGYQTINVGKNHFKPQRKALGFEINRIYETKADENKLPSDYHQWLEAAGKGMVKDTASGYDCNSWVVLPWTHASYFHPTEWTVDESIRQMRCKDPTRPFYLQTSFHRPHPPLDPPVNFLELYRDCNLPGPAVGDWAPQFEQATPDTKPFTARIDSEKLKLAKKAYYAQVTHIDSQIGKLLAWLQKNKMYDDTMIIFTSDHGEMLGDHNMFRKGPAMEGSAHIPLLIKGAVSKEIKPGPVFINSPVTLCDIMPTVLEAAEIDPAYNTDGCSLLPLMKNEEFDRPFIFGENYRSQKKIKDGWTFVVSKKSKYVWNSYSGQELFFDLINDPSELKNQVNNPVYKNEINIMRLFLKEQFKRRPKHCLLTKEGEFAYPVLLPSYLEPGN